MSLVKERQPSVTFGFMPKGSEVVFEETVNLKTGELIRQRVVSRHEHFNLQPTSKNVAQGGQNESQKRLA